MKITEDLTKQLEEFKNDKLTLTNGVLKLSKIIEDLKRKNSVKSEALKSIRNFFLNSTLFKIKKMVDPENEKTPTKEDEKMQTSNQPSTNKRDAPTPSDEKKEN
jgi:hypothetical protein